MTAIHDYNTFNNDNMAAAFNDDIALDEAALGELCPLDEFARTGVLPADELGDGVERHGLQLPGHGPYAADTLRQRALTQRIPEIAQAHGALPTEPIDGRPLDSMDSALMLRCYNWSGANEAPLTAPVTDATAPGQLLLGSVLAQTEIKCGLDQEPLKLRVALLAQPKLTERGHLVAYSVDKPENSSPVAILPNAEGQELGALPLVVFSLANIGSNLSSKGNNTPATKWRTLDPISGASCKLSQLLRRCTLVYPRDCASPLDVARLWAPPGAYCSLYICPIGDRTIRRNPKHQEQRRRSAALKRIERELSRAGNAKPRAEVDSIWLPPDDAVANVPQLGELLFEFDSSAMDVDAPLAVAASEIVLPFDTHGNQVLTPAAPQPSEFGDDQKEVQQPQDHQSAQTEQGPEVQQPPVQEEVQEVQEEEPEVQEVHPEVQQPPPVLEEEEEELAPRPAAEEEVAAAPDRTNGQKHEMQTRLRPRRHRTPTKRFAPY